MERVQAARFLCIAGPSGSGKSSLVQAGLIHGLRMGRLDGSRNWLYASLSPRGDPIEQLALAMARVAGKPDSAEYLRSRGADDPISLHQQAETLLSHDPAQRFVLYVDQFEELFTQTKNEERRTSFLALLTAAVNRDDGRVTVILSIRSDFLSQCAKYPGLLVLINQQFQLVGAMTAQELALAILKPALTVGVEIEPDLVAQVIAEMKGEPGTLPLMQFALKDLFDAQMHRKGDSFELTLDAYLAHGGIQQALERHANTVFAQFDEDQQAIARNVFSYLIEVGRSTVDTRRTATLAELKVKGLDAARVEAVVKALADARLVTTASTGTQRTLTIVHEKLIDAWPWLRQLVHDNRKAIALQNDVTSDAVDWENSDRDPSYLYSGAKLIMVLEQVAYSEITLADVARDFLAEGQKREEDRVKAEVQRQQRELRRKTQTIRVLSSVLGVIAFAISVWVLLSWARLTSPWQPTATYFPATPVLSMAVGRMSDGAMRMMCVGTMHIGVACTTNGLSWNIFQQGLPAGTPVSGGADRYAGQVRGVFGLTIDLADSETVYAYVTDGYVYKYSGADLRWIPSDTQLPDQSAARLTAYGDIVGAVVYNFLEDSEYRFYLSNDGGKTWLAETDIRFDGVRDIAIAPDGTEILAATRSGLFRSHLVGEISWSTVIDMPTSLVTWEASSQRFWFVSSSPNGNGWHLQYMEDDGQTVMLTPLKGRPISLAVDANFGLGIRAIVLLESGEILQIDANGSQHELGRYSRILPGRAYTVIAAHSANHLGSGLFLGHWDGLMEYRVTH